MTKLTEILNKFAGLKATDKGWQALCPAHDDTKPSLSIDVDHEKVLLHCHAGCEVEEVVEAAGLHLRDLFLTVPKARTLIATYDYQDEHGKLLYQMLRYEPKDFRARRPDGNGGWVYNLGDVRRVPYQLPKLLKAKSLLILEGEKDCQQARREMHVTATCNSGGSGKWRPELNPYFSGKQVIIIPDNDDPGEKHAHDVA